MITTSPTCSECYPFEPAIGVLIELSLSFFIACFSHVIHFDTQWGKKVEFLSVCILSMYMHTHKVQQASLTPKRHAEIRQRTHQRVFGCLLRLYKQANVCDGGSHSDSHLSQEVSPVSPIKTPSPHKRIGRAYSTEIQLINILKMISGSRKCTPTQIKTNM